MIFDLAGTLYECLGQYIYITVLSTAGITLLPMSIRVIIKKYILDICCITIMFRKRNKM